MSASSFKQNNDFLILTTATMPAPKDPPIFYMPPLPRQFKKYIYVQIVGLIIVVYIWYTLNGGLIPKFLLPKLPYFSVGPDVGSLVFFNVEGDASKIRWAREANSKEEIQKAMKDEQVHMIAADVILRGQGTTSQALVPVMGRPPSQDGQLTLRDWLDEITVGTKGIKLHLHSMEAVEISLQILNEYHSKYPIKFPVWIHADVLQGPFGDKSTISFPRFFKTLKRLFPKCTLSLGWTTGTHTDLTQSAYTWEMVWDMLDLVQEFDLSDQLVVFQARLSLIHNSVPQLKWLCDNVKHSTLMIWHEDGDIVVDHNIMYLAYIFPPHGVYFDLNHERFQTILDKFRHFSRDKVDQLVLARDQVKFRPEAWLKMGYHKQKNSILASTEAIILASPIVHIVSKSTYLPTPEISIQGRVQFFNRFNRKAEDYHTGINIYVRPSDYDHFDNIVAIRCFIGMGGEVEVTGSNLPDKFKNFRRTTRVTPTEANCFRFKITDEREQLVIGVRSFHDCTTLASVEEDEEMLPLMTVAVPANYEPTKQHPFVIKMEDVKSQALIDELSIKHKM